MYPCRIAIVIHLYYLLNLGTYHLLIAYRRSGSGARAPWARRLRAAGRRAYDAIPPHSLTRTGGTHIALCVYGRRRSGLNGEYP
eukprot:SAG31_NODE_982_length_10556_cov_18.203883_6_plen_84_part_00